MDENRDLSREVLNDSLDHILSRQMAICLREALVLQVMAQDDTGINSSSVTAS
jgi:hypothetical protein